MIGQYGLYFINLHFMDLIGLNFSGRISRLIYHIVKINQTYGDKTNK